MAVDPNVIKGQIDSNLTDGIRRENKASTLKTLLKLVVDWVTFSINNNLTTWLRTSDNQPGGANGDGVYRTGMVEMRGGVKGLTSQTNNNGLSQQGFDLTAGMEVKSNANARPAFMNFHVPGVVIHQLGVDTDGILKLHPWNTSVSHEIMASGYNTKIATNSTLSNKKVVIYDTVNNDHQFYGIGLQGGQFRTQVATIGDRFSWLAGTSPLTSDEVMTLLASGRLLLGTTNDNGQGDFLQINGSMTGKYRSSAAALTTAQLPTGNFTVHRNTANGQCRLYVNNNGTIQSILFA